MHRVDRLPIVMHASVETPRVSSGLLSSVNCTHQLVTFDFNSHTKLACILVIGVQIVCKSDWHHTAKLVSNMISNLVQLP